MTFPTTPPPATIPVREDFPIRWSQPEHEQLPWFQDLMHNPTPITPLTASIHCAAFAAGATRAIQDLSLPIVALHQDTQNHYVYLSATPFMGTPEEMEARFAGMQAMLGRLMPGFLDRFYAEYVPRILAFTDRNRQADHTAMSLPELCARVVELRQDAEALWDMHMQINIPSMVAVFGFDEFLASVLGPEIEHSGHLMLQGFPNKSVETGHALWEIAEAVRVDETLASLIRETPASRLRAVLSESAPGRAFLDNWGRFLDEYGWRSGGFELSDPSWIEDWTVPINQLRAYLAGLTEDPLEAQHRQAVERDRIVAEIEAKLPAEVLPVFHMMLAGAQTYIPIAEDHNFYIDQMAFTATRLPVLALGDRLVEAGYVDSRDDVFFLTVEEIGAIGAGDTSDRRAVVAERRASLEATRGTIPPEMIGTPPPADAPPEPLLTKFFGIGHNFVSDAKVIRGIPSSSGTITGTVKVVRTLAEADKLDTGDIMVVHMTMPAWTPLFATVGAVVADSGGVLSHCSIVAREYGIPCVTATRVGTRLLKDGQTVSVDGSRGIVRVL